ncbi:L-glutamate gamma-semialdehyde dehydrogenase [Opitutaceae bacterium EW11]|nr:L-glutamate gamma-semialdehyde dehydrogenase [Opitutaceae bacterium EW11]
MDRFLTPDQGLESEIRARGGALLDTMDRQPGSALFSKKGAYARLMDWAMKDAAFKTQLFRFVDVLPSLDSSAEIVRHLQEYLGDKAVELNPALKAGLAASSFAPSLVAGPVKAQILDLASQFVAGKDPDDLVRQIEKNAREGLATTIDLLGEAVVSESEADAFLKRNLAVLDTVSRFLERSAPCASDLGPGGKPLPRLNLSVKVSALTPDVHPADPEPSIVALKARLRPILRRAREVGALINFDMESYKLKDLTLALFRSILEEDEFREGPAVGIALQAYLRECEDDLRALISWSRGRRRPINIRLVKGAYWDFETLTARQRGWPVPVWQKKPESDANFEKLSVLLLENVDAVTPNFATHNVRSVAHAIARAERLGIDPKAYEFQALYGMADDLKAALLKLGHRVREYCAIGDLLPGMAYLVRRLLENTSNEGFLRREHHDGVARDQLLGNPVEAIASAPEPLPERVKQPGEFVNSAGTDFSRADSRARQHEALRERMSSAPKRWPLIVAGKSVADREYAASVNPAHPSQIVGYWARASRTDADSAVSAARAAFPSWSRQPVEVRAGVLERTADLMEERRFELNALLIAEAGKPWIEADGDVSEAIDFCRFYAVEMRKLGAPSRAQDVPGERCMQRWVPRGVGVSIAPWNFPLAILTGLVVAPFVAGNCVVMKPAEQTTVIAAHLMNLLTEAGAPPGVLSFLPGLGEEVGVHLVEHREVDFIAFTGSRAVGCAIWEAAGRTLQGQKNLKKVVCEMGGKNAIVVDNDADLDEAIPAVLASAFGFSGQKCSALSRLIVLDGVYERFVGRLLAACDSCPIGDPAEPGTVIGPVIDADAKEKILRLIEQGKREARLAWQGTIPTELARTGGYYVPPTVFVDVRREHVLAREEIFGPVLSVLRAKNLDDAFELANATDFALTGGLFSRSPSALRRAEEEMRVGNLYLNRGITGAIVERHPFGGYGMSGAGTKAGGKEYLQNFLFPRAIAENTLRRGFAPETD